MRLLQKILGGQGDDVRELRLPTRGGAAGESSSILSQAVVERRTDVIAASDKRNEAGEHAEALALIDDALSRAPYDSELLIAKGATLYEWGRAREARECLLRADAISTGDIALHLKLGWTCFVAGHLDEAIEWMRKAAEGEGAKSTKGRFGLAIALQAKGHTEEAARNFEEVLASDRDNYECLIQLGSCKVDSGNPIAGEAYFRRAISVKPELATAWTNLGAALYKQDRAAEGLEAFETADQIERDRDQDVDNFINLAVAHSDEGRLTESLAIYERCLPCRPTARGHFGYAGVLLRAGRMREGWSHYEFRWTAEPLHSNRAKYSKPPWNGQDLCGRTILLHSEQGFGDSIQFLRYAAMLKTLGATVVLRAIPGFESLARRIAGVDRVVCANEPIPDFDFYAHLMSLPRVFGTDLDSIPADVPYLIADPNRVAHWKSKLGIDARRKIGLVWAGNPRHERDRYRSINLNALTSLVEVDGVQFVSLQKGPPANDVAMAPIGRALLDAAPELHDFEDTAALVSALDLVIAVDTAVLHLAGALGKPAWALLPSPPDFRWLEAREDSPWYPTMRLFRQRVRDDWTEVIDRVAAALREVVQSSNAKETASLMAPAAAQLPSATALGAGAAPGVRQDFFAIAETRLGLLQYRPHDVPVGRSLDWYGEYLQPQLDILARLVRPGATIMEVGAGIGAHSVFLSSLVGPNGHLMIYERDPLLKRIVHQNVSFAGSKNVTVMRKMLGIPSTETEPSETLDALRLGKLHLLKINEGISGLAVLDGAGDTLWRLRPILFIAASDNAALEQVGSRVKEFGYRCLRIDTPLFNPQNFNRRNDDIFAGRAVITLLALPEEAEIGEQPPEWVELP